MRKRIDHSPSDRPGESVAFFAARDIEARDNGVKAPWRFAHSLAGQIAVSCEFVNANCVWAVLNVFQQEQQISGVARSEAVVMKRK